MHEEVYCINPINCFYMHVKKKHHFACLRADVPGYDLYYDPHIHQHSFHANKRQCFSAVKKKVMFIITVKTADSYCTYTLKEINYYSEGNNPWRTLKTFKFNTARQD
ncbi:hypothetical protein XENORESO_000891 [Xenotaenia resolanae]|uniref:Uncharacterized protein n=1 Tax=Xenotaenia resolanae TaxID=208358 RepID=A0ABV0WHV9_9TELE